MAEADEAKADFPGWIIANFILEQDQQTYLGELHKNGWMMQQTGFTMRWSTAGLFYWTSPFTLTLIATAARSLEQRMMP